MNCIFKKSAIALVALGLASTSFAGAFTGFFGGLEGSYLQARNGDLNFVTLYPGYPDDLTGPIRNVSIGDVENNWAFRLFGGMSFCGGDDITMSYFRYNTSNGKALGALPVTVYPRWSVISEFTDIGGRVTFLLDDYYLELGHTFALSQPWNIRIATGGEYTRLDSDMTVKGTLTSIPTIPETGYTAKSGLRAAGPRLSIGSTYALPYSLSVFARGNAAVLIGHRNISLNTLYATSSNLFPSFFYKQRTPIVPKFGLRAGIGYSAAYGVAGGEGGASPTGTTFGIEAGWEVESYVHAIERPSGGLLPVVAVAPGVRRAPVVNNTDTVTSNYTYQGPFINLNMRTYWL